MQILQYLVFKKKSVSMAKSFTNMVSKGEENIRSTSHKNVKIFKRNHFRS